MKIDKERRKERRGRQKNNSTPKSHSIRNNNNSGNSETKNANERYIPSFSLTVAYLEFARGQDCRLQNPVTLYSFRQKFWVDVLHLYQLVTSSSCHSYFPVQIEGGGGACIQLSNKRKRKKQGSRHKSSSIYSC